MAAGEEEGTREERLETARRYRERRGAELRGLAERALGHEVEAAGEFSSVPTEALAAIPLLGMFFLPWARWRARRQGLPAALLLAVAGDAVHALGLSPANVRRDRVDVARSASWPRDRVHVRAVRRAFMRDAISLAVPDRDEPLVLYAPTLRTNPWSADVVRRLGGEAPEPLDLGPGGPHADPNDPSE